jgi:hypothetical protein
MTRLLIGLIVALLSCSIYAAGFNESVSIKNNNSLLFYRSGGILSPGVSENPAITLNAGGLIFNDDNGYITGIRDGGMGTGLFYIPSTNIGPATYEAVNFGQLLSVANSLGDVISQSEDDGKKMGKRLLFGDLVNYIVNINDMLSINAEKKFALYANTIQIGRESSFSPTASITISSTTNTQTGSAAIRNFTTVEDTASDYTIRANSFFNVADMFSVTPNAQNSQGAYGVVRMDRPLNMAGNIIEQVAPGAEFMFSMADESQPVTDLRMYQAINAGQLQSVYQQLVDMSKAYTEQRIAEIAGLTNIVPITINNAPIGTIIPWTPLGTGQGFPRLASGSFTLTEAYPVVNPNTRELTNVSMSVSTKYLIEGNNMIWALCDGTMWQAKEYELQNQQDQTVRITLDSPVTTPDFYFAQQGVMLSSHLQANIGSQWRTNTYGRNNCVSNVDDAVVGPKFYVATVNYLIRIH